MANVFFSYSHQDEELRNELEVHLSMLKREGLIEAWHDRRISAGENIGSSIDSALEQSKIILLLVSAHFLASDYCFNNEMMKAIQKHEEGIARVIPVILHPCDWHSAPFGTLRATPPDGKPVSMFANRDNALALVAKDIRDAVETLEEKPVKKVLPDLSMGRSINDDTYQPRSSNLRVKRTFSHEEVDRFLLDTYEYISRYFEASLQELVDRNSQLSTRFRRIDSNCFTASIYNKGVRSSECTIWLGGLGYNERSISYSDSITTNRNQLNESLTVLDDGYSLDLRAMGFAFTRPNPNKNLTQEGAAEYYWGIMISPLQ